MPVDLLVDAGEAAGLVAGARVSSDKGNAGAGHGLALECRSHGRNSHSWLSQDHPGSAAVQLAEHGQQYYRVYTNWTCNSPLGAGDAARSAGGGSSRFNSLRTIVSLR